MKAVIRKFIGAVLSVCLIVSCCSLTAFAVGKTVREEFDVSLRSRDATQLSANGYAVGAQTTSKKGAHNLALEMYIVHGWDDLVKKQNVTSYNISVEEFQTLYFDLLFKYPEYFYVSNKFACYYNEETRIVSGFEPTYTCNDTAQLLDMKTELDNAIFGLLDTIDENMTAEQMILATHDYIVMNCSYDVDGYYAGTPANEYISTAYGCLVKKTALCEGFTKAFSIIMDFFGIDNYYVTSDKMGHAWNMVKLEGNYYHVDLTWDNTLAIAGDYYYNQAGICSHKYFLKTDAQLLQAKHSDWVVDYKALVQLSGRWEGVDSAFFYINGVYYYVGATGEITRFDNATKQAKVLLKVPDSEWGRNGNNYYKWPGNSARLAYYNGRMYYNTNSTIYELNMTTGAAVMVYKPTINMNCVNGIEFVDGKLCYDMLAAKSYQSRLVVSGSVERVVYSSSVNSYNSAGEQLVQRGDINGDGAVNQMDILALRRVIVSGNTPSVLVGDMYRDGIVNMKDVAVLRSYVASKIYNL